MDYRVHILFYGRDNSVVVVLSDLETFWEEPESVLTLFSDPKQNEGRGPWRSTLFQNSKYS